MIRETYFHDRELINVKFTLYYLQFSIIVSSFSFIIFVFFLYNRWTFEPDFSSIFHFPSLHPLRVFQILYFSFFLFFLFSLPHKNRFWFRSLIAVFHYTILDFLFPRFIFFFPCKPFHPFHPGPHFSLFSNAKVFDFYIPNFPSLSFLFYTFIDFLNSDKPILFRGLSWRTFRNRSTHQRSLSAFSTNPQLIVSETPRFHQTFNL